jgi:hypothetical protein
VSKHRFLLRWRLAFLVGAIALLLAGLKFVLGYIGAEPFSANAFLPSLLAGTLILLGFLMAGVLSDFKEAEKIPTEIAASLRNIWDEGHYVKELKRDFDLEKLKGIVHRVLTNFLDEIGSGNSIDKTLETLSELNEPFLEMERLNIPVAYLSRLKNEQGTLRRIILRANYIKANSFIRAAFVTAQAATAIVIIFLLLVKTDPLYEGIALVLAIAFLLIYILFLIKDMDDPFEFGGRGSRSLSGEVEVDPSQLYHLKRDLELSEKTQFPSLEKE